MKRISFPLTLLPLTVVLACGDDGAAPIDTDGTDTTGGTEEPTTDPSTDPTLTTTTTADTSSSGPDEESSSGPGEESSSSGPGEESSSGPGEESSSSGPGESSSESSSGVFVGCGDGIINGDEECDDGEANADDAACTVACIAATCGDGLVFVGQEDCDDMGESASCNADCSASSCGDGILNVTSGEVCEAGMEVGSCVDEGFIAGDLGCDAQCAIDESPCFTSVTFETCGQSGNLGPSQEQCDATYANGALAGAVMVDAGYQSWLVPADGTYRIDVAGAQGGDHDFGPGGGGARVQGDFDLLEGDELVIVVGQSGSDGTAYDVGGGGGTFVVRGDDIPLAIAGGGGGAGNCAPIDGAVITGKSMLGDGDGGVGGNDGLWCGCGGDGSPGGGFFTSASPNGGDGYFDGAQGDDTERPQQCVDSGLGGFGGGGNGGNGGGGGGGYEGGDAGGSLITGQVTGAGGESYNDGANPIGEDGVNLGEGIVTITRL